MDAILIAGPTASGKSGLAARLAEAHGGTVVNADSMQVYAPLRILTARPVGPVEDAVEHRLYGHVAGDDPYSTGRWIADLRGVLNDLKARGKTAVIVGGTGLYFEALLGGLSSMPGVPRNIRQSLRARLAEEGAAVLHAELAMRDRETASSLRPADGQRIVRALEVLEATGRSIRSFQSRPGKALIDPVSARRILLAPDRAVLRDRIGARFDAMMTQGALDEVAALLRQKLDPAMPVMKAIGVRELAAHLGGEIDRETAIARAVAASRQYAKRQETWFRNRFSGDWLRYSSADSVN